MLSCLSRKTLLFSSQNQGDAIIRSGLCSNCQHVNPALMKEEIKHVTEKISNSSLYIPDQPFLTSLAFGKTAKSSKQRNGTRMCSVHTEGEPELWRGDAAALGTGPSPLVLPLTCSTPPAAAAAGGSDVLHSAVPF